MKEVKDVRDGREGREGREEGNRNLEFRTETRVGKVRHPSSSVMLSFEGPKNVVQIPEGHCHFSSRNILDQTSELITSHVHYVSSDGFSEVQYTNHYIIDSHAPPGMPCS
jgi:hypothetical protein